MATANLLSFVGREIHDALQSKKYGHRDESGGFG